MATKVTIDLRNVDVSIKKLCNAVAKKSLAFVVQSAKTNIRKGKNTSSPGKNPRIHKDSAKNWLVQHSEDVNTTGSGNSAYSVARLGATYITSKTTNDSLVTLNEGGPNKGTFISRYRKNLKKKVSKLPKSSPLFYKDER